MLIIEFGSIILTLLLLVTIFYLSPNNKNRITILIFMLALFIFSITNILSVNYNIKTFIRVFVLLLILGNIIHYYYGL